MHRSGSNPYGAVARPMHHDDVGSDTQVQDSSVLRRIVKDLDGTLSLDSFVEEEGIVHVGQRVELIED